MIFKSLCTAVLLICLMDNAQAQISLGAGAGPNLNFRNWTFEVPGVELGALNYQAGVGGQAALRLEYQAGARFTLCGEAGWQALNSRLQVEVTDVNGASRPGQMTETLQSLTSGLFTKFTFFERVKGYLLAGPSVAWLQNGKRRLKGSLIDGQTEKPTYTINLDQEQYNRTLLFLNLGVGAAVPCRQRGQLFAELRYQYGLSEGNNNTNVNASASNVLLNLGYLFRL